MVQDLASLRGRISLIELRVPGNAQEIQGAADRLQAATSDVRVEPIRQIAETEGALLGRVRLLIVSMAALIFVLTALSVLATMTALAMERRVDVGLMKALGGSIGRIVALFLAEVSVLGVVGGRGWLFDWGVVDDLDWAERVWGGDFASGGSFAFDCGIDGGRVIGWGAAFAFAWGA